MSQFLSDDPSKRDKSNFDGEMEFIRKWRTSMKLKIKNLKLH